MKLHGTFFLFWKKRVFCDNAFVDCQPLAHELYGTLSTSFASEWIPSTVSHFILFSLKQIRSKPLYGAMTSLTSIFDGKSARVHASSKIAANVRDHLVSLLQNAAPNSLQVKYFYRVLCCTHTM